MVTVEMGVSVTFWVILKVMAFADGAREEGIKDFEYLERRMAAC